MPAAAATVSRFSSDGRSTGGVEAPRNQPVDAPAAGKQLIGNLQRNPHVAAADNVVDRASDFVHGGELWVGKVLVPARCQYCRGIRVESEGIRVVSCREYRRCCWRCCSRYWWWRWGGDGGGEWSLNVVCWCSWLAMSMRGGKVHIRAAYKHLWICIRESNLCIYVFMHLCIYASRGWAICYLHYSTIYKHVDNLHRR